jgi:hypothetical protein
MATKLFTIHSFITFHPNYDGGDNCSQCGTRRGVKYAFQFDYETSCIIDWRLDREFEDHGEVPVCVGCADRFDFDALLEI